MTQVIQFTSAKDITRPLKPAGLSDAVRLLSDALGPEWVIERSSNYDAELTIVVSSRFNPDARPTFVLFEQDNWIRLGTLENDEWQTDRSSQSLLHSVTAVIAKAAAASKPDHSVPSVRL